MCDASALLRMLTASSTTPKMATARRSAWGNPSSAAVGRATRPRRAWDTTRSTSTRPSPLRSCARSRARAAAAAAVPTRPPRNEALSRLCSPSRSHYRITCMHLSRFPAFFFCHSFMRYTIIFTHFLEQKSIFVVFLMLNICTFVSIVFYHNPFF